MRALSLSVRFSSIELLTQSPIHRPSELIKILIYDFEGGKCDVNRKNHRGTPRI